MMRTTKWLLILAMLMLPTLAASQTTVNITVTDTPDNQTWNNGTYAAQLVGQSAPSAPSNPSGTFTLLSGGGSIANQSGSLTSTGTASISLPANANIAPLSQWRISVCPQASSACFTQLVTVSTTTPQTVTMTPASPRINLQTTPPPVLGYSTGEIVGASIGSTFYLIGTGQQVCGVVSGNLCTSWTGVGSGVGATFNLANFGAVDDDSTDNCANGSVAAFTTAVNAYSGPGVPIAVIPATNKAFKLATAANSCTFAFTRLLGGVHVYLLGTIDCAQTAQSCIQLGPSGIVTENNAENYTVDGPGTLINGANLTLAGIYVEPGVVSFRVSHLQFGVSEASSTTGFGASNGTLGNCTNYAIYVDNPVAQGIIDHILAYIASSSTTAGGCGFANPNGAASGTNTVYYEHNEVGTGGAVSPGTQCGSQAIVDGGSYGMVIDNNIYGFGVPVRIQGIGHRAVGNQIDAASCIAHGVSAAFHVGAASSSTAVGPITLESNVGQFNSPSGHTLFLMAIAGDSTATISGAAIIGNQNSNVPPTTVSPIPTTLACTPQASPCTIAGNQGFLAVNPGLSGSNGSGWGVVPNMAGVYANDGVGANIGATLMVNAPTSHGSYLQCLVVLTTRDAASSTLPSCQATFTDAFTSVSVTKTITNTDTTNVVGTTQQSGQINFNPNAATAINISTTGYASGTAGVMKYSVRAYLIQY